MLSEGGIVEYFMRSLFVARLGVQKGLHCKRWKLSRKLGKRALILCALLSSLVVLQAPLDGQSKDQRPDPKKTEAKPKPAPAQPKTPPATQPTKAQEVVRRVTPATPSQEVHHSTDTARQIADRENAAQRERDKAIARKNNASKPKKPPSPPKN